MARVGRTTGRVFIGKAVLPAARAVGQRLPVADALPPLPFPGAVLFLRAPFGDPPPSPSNVGQRFPIETPSPPPFPGAVIRLVNPYGDPPPSIASSQLTQFHVETPSPPAFAGQVISVSNRAPVQPPSIAPVIAGPGQSTIFPGGVLSASATRFGISSLPARPFFSATASPPAFPGMVLANRPRVEVVRDEVPTPVIVRMPEAPPQLALPQFRRGTPPRDAMPAGARVITGDTQQTFPGKVLALRNAFGVSSLPNVKHPSVVQMASALGEPGRVMFARLTPPSISEVMRPAIVRMESPAALEHRLPLYSSGTHERPAASPRGVVVSGGDLQPGEQGRVIRQRGSFGISPLPARPMVAKLEGDTPYREAGRIAAVGRSAPTAPVQRPVSVVVVMPPTGAPFPGSSLFSAGRAAPAVIAPRPMLVMGDTSYPEVHPSFFGWGWRMGSGAPGAASAGNPVTIIGEDQAVLTLDSTDCCPE